MLVYGDPTRTEDARAKLSAIALALRDVGAMPAGIARHGALVAAFIEVGELAQGVADADFAARGGRDGRSPAADAALALLTRLAAVLRSSWDSGFALLYPVPAEVAPGALGAGPLPDTRRTSARRASPSTRCTRKPTWKRRARRGCRTAGVSR